MLRFTALSRRLPPARTRVLARALDAALVVAAVALLAAPHNAHAAAAKRVEYGVNLGMVTQLPADERDRHLAEIAAAGLTTARTDASWMGAEPDAPDPVTGEHRYHWDAYDAIAGSLAAHGLRWYPILDYGTNWAATIPGDPFSAPSDPQAFAAYAAAFAARYGPAGTFWAEHPELPKLPVAAYEIWNEPNASMFWRQQDTAPEGFADLYALSHDAIHAVDPTADVVTGGLLDANATEPNGFLRRMIAHRPDLRKGIDAVGYHPYQLSLEDMVDGVRRLRRTLTSLGMGTVPIELTEVGMTTAWVSEADRTRALGGLARSLPTSGLGVTRMLPFEWLGPDADPGKWDDWYGLVRRDGSVKPGGAAYLAAVRAAAQPVAAAGSTASKTAVAAAARPATRLAAVTRKKAAARRAAARAKAARKARAKAARQRRARQRARALRRRAARRSHRSHARS